ncbi:MAG: DNA repair protein RadC [Bacteroidales bacterium]|nr:DNA repair protein RadC [Bacteroidales bacterium]
MKLLDWDRDERPREKLLRLGPSALGNAELLAIFISSGTPGTNAVEAAQALLSSAGGRLTELCKRTPKELMKARSVGPARAVTIAAALELGRRYFSEVSAGPPVVTGPEDVVRLMLPLLKGLDHEECWVLYLNRSNHVTGRERLTSGTADATLIDPKSVLRGAISHQAKAVILVHNHPSGSPMPGEADIWETQRLRQALKALDVKLFDHVILSDCAWYSFQDERCRPADRL